MCKCLELLISSLLLSHAGAIQGNINIDNFNTRIVLPTNTFAYTFGLFLGVSESQLIYVEKTLNELETLIFR